MPHSYTRTRNLQYTLLGFGSTFTKVEKKILSRCKKKGKKKKIEKVEGW